MKAIKAKVTGKVQGVYFRQHTLNKAQELGVRGFVRNEADKSVYLEAEGEEQAVNELLAWCHRGPRLARVDEVVVELQTPQGFSSFEIIR